MSIKKYYNLAPEAGTSSACILIFFPLRVNHAYHMERKEYEKKGEVIYAWS